MKLQADVVGSAGKGLEVVVWFCFVVLVLALVAVLFTRLLY